MTNQPKDYQQDWDDFWLEIVKDKDGNIDIEQVKKELSDFKMIMDSYSKVLYHITSGALSKCTYPAETVISVADDSYRKCFDEEHKEIIAKAAKWDALDDAIGKFYQYDEETGEEIIPDGFDKDNEPDLGTIGEIAASHLGYL